MILTLGIFGLAQEKNSDTEVVIISGDESLSADEVEITIKKNGKKIKLKEDQIKIIPKSSRNLSFHFGDIMEGDIMGGFDFRDMRSQMRNLLEQFQGMNDFDFELEREFDKLPEGSNRTLEDFSTEFENLGNEKSNKIELGEGRDTYIFKSDDGRPIVEEEETIIMKKEKIEGGDTGIFKNGELNEGKPLIFLNGEAFKGTLEDIDPDTIISVQVEKGTVVQEKFGDKAKDGVMYIITK